MLTLVGIQLTICHLYLLIITVYLYAMAAFSNTKQVAVNLSKHMNSVVYQKYHFSNTYFIVSKTFLKTFENRIWNFDTLYIYDFVG